MVLISFAFISHLGMKVKSVTVFCCNVNVYQHRLDVHIYVKLTIIHVVVRFEALSGGDYVLGCEGAWPPSSAWKRKPKKQACSTK
jgi:hypothetical protein